MLENCRSRPQNPTLIAEAGAWCSAQLVARRLMFRRPRVRGCFGAFWFDAYVHEPCEATENEDGSPRTFVWREREYTVIELVHEQPVSSAQQASDVGAPSKNLHPNQFLVSTLEAEIPPYAGAVITVRYSSVRKPADSYTGSAILLA